MKRVLDIARVTLTVESLMTKPVLTIDPNQNLMEAAKMMREHNIGSLVVAKRLAKRDEIMGIITERDFISVAAEHVDVKRTRVKEVMSMPVITCEPDTSLLELIAIMEKKNIQHVPVVKDGKLVGMVSSYDLAIYGICV